MEAGAEYKSGLIRAFPRDSNLVFGIRENWLNININGLIKWCISNQQAIKLQELKLQSEFHPNMPNRYY